MFEDVCRPNQKRIGAAFCALSARLALESGVDETGSGPGDGQNPKQDNDTNETRVTGKVGVAAVGKSVGSVVGEFDHERRQEKTDDKRNESAEDHEH